MFTMYQENGTKFGSKNEILQIFVNNKVASYRYIIVDLCIISFIELYNAVEAIL